MHIQSILSALFVLLVAPAAGAASWQATSRDGAEGTICGTRVFAEDGATLLAVEAGEGAYAVLLSNPAWRFDPSAAPIDVAVTVLSADAVATPVPAAPLYGYETTLVFDGSPELLATLKQAHRIRFAPEADGSLAPGISGPVEIDLTGSAAALKAVAACAGY